MTVASRVGTKPSTEREPFIIGTPATSMLSLIATVLPESDPCIPRPSRPRGVSKAGCGVSASSSDS